jgi:hypothetical protein
MLHHYSQSSNVDVTGAYQSAFQQEVLGRINRLLSFDKARGEYKIIRRK